MKHAYIGTSGYNYREWKGDFYPEDIPQTKWLEYYAEQFSSLEINATFYRSFPQTVYAKWYQRTPMGFTFVLKGPRRITHIKRLKDIDEELELFFAAHSALKEKLSCVLWQFPNNFKNNDEKLELFTSFLERLPKTTRHAVELRDISWFGEDVFEVLNKQKIGFVINDSNTFPTATAITSDFAYIRFHGPDELYASGYTENQMRDWSEQIQKWLTKYDVYCYFNNDMDGHAYRDARTLQTLLS